MDLDDDAPPDLVDTDIAVRIDQPSAQSEVLTAQLSDTHISRVPLTIITGILASPLVFQLELTKIEKKGYLGSGKTTLVNYVLRAHHGKKIAVILNGLYPPLPASTLLLPPYISPLPSHLSTSLVRSPFLLLLIPIAPHRTLSSKVTHQPLPRLPPPPPTP